MRLNTPSKRWSAAIRCFFASSNENVSVAGTKTGGVPSLAVELEVFALACALLGVASPFAERDFFEACALPFVFVAGCFLFVAADLVAPPSPLAIFDSGALATDTAAARLAERVVGIATVRDAIDES